MVGHIIFFKNFVKLIVLLLIFILTKIVQVQIRQTEIDFVRDINVLGWSSFYEQFGYAGTCQRQVSTAFLTPSMCTPRVSRIILKH